MRIGKSNYYYKINTEALSEAVKCAKYETKDPILILELKLPSFYESIVNDNEVSKMQELIDHSNCKNKIYSITAVTGVTVIQTSTRQRFKSQYRYKTKKIICVIKKYDGLEFAFVEVELSGQKVKRIATLCRLNKPNIPVILTELPCSYNIDFHFINDEAIKVQLYGLSHFCFIYGHNVYFSAITKSKRQSAFQIGSLLSNVSILFSELCNMEQDEINVKINVSSPGGIVFGIEKGLFFLESNWECIAFLSALVFGGSYTNGEKVYELPSVRNLLIKMLSVKYELKTRELHLKEKELEIEDKELDVKMKELEFGEKKIKLEQKKRELMLQEGGYNYDTLKMDESLKKIEEIIDSIFETASQIDIAVPKDDLIEIDEIMKILDTPLE